MTGESRLKLADRLADEAVDVTAIAGIVGVTVAADPSTTVIAGIVAIAAGRRGIKGLSSIAG